MRDPLFWVPIKYKLPMTFAVICLTAFGIGGYLVASVATRSLEEQIRFRLDEYSATTALMVDRQLELLGRRVEDFASDGFIRTRLAELVADGGARSRTEQEQARARLKRHMERNKLPLVKDFVDAFLLDKRGHPVLEVRSSAPPRPASHQAAALWFGPLEAAAKAHPYPTFLISTPVRSLDAARQIGFLQILVRADTWVARLRAHGMLPCQAPFQSWLQDAKGHELLLASSGAEGKVHAKSSASDAEASVIGYTTTLPRNGWQLHLEVDKHHVMRPITHLLKRFLVTGGILLLLVLALLFFPARFLVKPLGDLRASAQRIAEGDFSATVKIDSRDEIGDLSRAFNIMANAVGERTRRLEEAAAELEQREAEIRTERDRLNMVLRSMQDGLFILDRAGRVTLSNRAAQPIVSVLMREKEPLRTQPECKDGDGTIRNCLDCLREASKPFHFCEVHVDGRVFEIHGTTLPAVHGSAAERLFVTRDITERRAQSERQAHQERMAVLGQIAAVMAHELNNPLAAIAMFSQMLESGLEPGSAHRESAEVIRRNAETCKETIRMLLDTTASAAPEFSEFDFADLLRDVQRFLRPLFQRAGARLYLDTTAKDTRLVGDLLQLRQVVVNLLMNACQAGEGRGVEVRVTLEDRGEELVLRVTDSGPGIAAAVREHIFKPFFTTKPPGVGTGLGLPTSKRIVEAHGGKLELLESKPGKSVFQAVLPRRSRPAGVPTASPAERSEASVRHA